MSLSPLSRRSFLRSAGIGAAGVWIPKSVTGYSTDEFLPGAADGGVRPSVAKWELETPALCLDLDRMERNLDRMESTLSRNGIRSRPHAKTHKTPAIARLQIDRGAVGICVAKLGEAEVMAEHGVEEILLTTVNVTPSKIQRAMILRKWCDGFIQSVDNPDNARDLSEAARAAGVVADVVVDVDPGGHRTGVPPGNAALELAQLVDGLPGLRLRGMEAYDGGSQHVKGFEERRSQTLAAMEAPAETYRLLRRSGLNAEIFTGGGTGTYNIDHETPGFTDVQCGSYCFMDAQYLAVGGRTNDEVYDDFESSLTVVTTVLNSNFEGRATADAGAKALTINEPDPIVVGERDISYRARSDEFGTIQYGENASRTYRTGEKLEVVVPHCDPVVNLYDHVYGIRGETVEVIWPIAARGKSV